ncbi:hypothetical protein JYU34_017859 [Plutella xylostella]|uniref:Uncharacterized protein n=1 Tax=Plutella xylostella TaxID=51655 RepID=A0ABQ7PZ59_PLUXY|nr:hypothetical protein JYU34_017859 [Plutella xylostella]
MVNTKDDQKQATEQTKTNPQTANKELVTTVFTCTNQPNTVPGPNYTQVLHFSCGPLDPSCPASPYMTIFETIPEPLPEHKVSIDPPTPPPPSHPTPDPPPANNDFVTMICYRPTLSMVPPTYTKGTFLSYHALAPHPLRALCGACLIVFGYLIHFIMNCLCSCCICFDYNRVTRLSEY